MVTETDKDEGWTWLAEGGECGRAGNRSDKNTNYRKFAGKRFKKIMSKVLS